MLRDLSCLSIACLFALLSANAHGVVLLEAKSPKNEAPTRVLYDGHIMRVDFTQGGYLLFDVAANKRYMVSDEQKQVMEMPNDGAKEFSAMMSDLGAKRTPARIDIERLGDGPTIAGYATEHYVVTADGQKCSDEYLSKDLLRNKEIKDLVHAMDSANEREDDQSVASLGPCMVQAPRALAKEYDRLGLPLRTVDADGATSVEVVSIKVDVSVPESTFSLPAEYSRVSLDDVIRHLQTEALEIH